MHKESADELLGLGLQQLDMPLTEEQANKFLVYLEELKKWNRAYNLTAIKSDADIVIKHFLDSLLFLKVLPADVKAIADIGSGAGFPGLPMKIMRNDLEVTLVEPVQKKALFLEHMKRTLRLEGLDIRNQRIEDLRDIKVDAAVTRALFSIKEFVAKAGGLLHGPKVLILSKGPKLENELDGVFSSAVQTIPISLPFQNVTRHLVVIRVRP